MNSDTCNKAVLKMAVAKKEKDYVIELVLNLWLRIF